MFDRDILDKAQQVISSFSARSQMVATAESCTGGLIGGALTEISGSSAVFDRGFITYSNEAKAELLSVDPALIAKHGAVSEETAREMVRGIFLSCEAAYGVAVTGIAGPGGGSEEKPVGLVYIAASQRDGKPVVTKNLFGDVGRQEVRRLTVLKALDLLLSQARP